MESWCSSVNSHSARRRFRRRSTMWCVSFSKASAPLRTHRLCWRGSNLTSFLLDFFSVSLCLCGCLFHTIANHRGTETQRKLATDQTGDGEGSTGGDAADESCLQRASHRTSAGKASFHKTKNQQRNKCQH